MKKHLVRDSKVNICIYATPKEQRMFNCCRRYLHSPSNADVIRRLLEEKYEKILSKNTPVGVEQEA